MKLDVKDFYNGTPMDLYEYMKLALDFLPDEIIKKYNLHSLVCSNGWIYMDIRKGMPGLKQAVRIVNNRLKLHLDQFGYAPVPRTPALWKHVTRDITFSVVVVDSASNILAKKIMIT